MVGAAIHACYDCTCRTDQIGQIDPNLLLLIYCAGSVFL